MSFVVNGVKVKYDTIPKVWSRLEEEHENPSDSSIIHTSISRGCDWFCKLSWSDVLWWIDDPAVLFFDKSTTIIITSTTHQAACVLFHIMLMR